MSAGTSEFFCLICFLVCSCSAQTNITAEVGKEVILLCKAPNINNILVVEWSRPELEPEYVLLYRDGHFDPDSQHPSYQNRVDLQDKEMKDGDVSLILKNVTKNDTGKYRCRVYQRTTNQKTWSPKIESIVNLEVLLSGNKDEITGDGGDKTGGDEDGGDKIGVIVGSVVGVILLLLVVSVGFLIYRRHVRQNQHHLPVPPNEAAAEPMSTFLSSNR